ncbi:MAG TPA: hypothetical protein VI112_10495, partial [Bacteroidia bacterium]
MRYFVTACILVSLSCGTATVNSGSWKQLDKGLFLAEFPSPLRSSIGDSKITVLKIDPAFYEFRLVSSKEKNEPNKTAKDWAKEYELLAVINAGMFRDDGKTNTGFMKNYDFVNNPELSSDNSIIAFDRCDSTVPFFQVIDRECQDWEVLKNKYHTFSQGIRMIDCRQKNK